MSTFTSFIQYWEERREMSLIPGIVCPAASRSMYSQSNIVNGLYLNVDSPLSVVKINVYPATVIPPTHPPPGKMYPHVLGPAATGTPSAATGYLYITVWAPPPPPAVWPHTTSCLRARCLSKGRVGRPHQQVFVTLSQTWVGLLCENILWGTFTTDGYSSATISN